jgi:hypothetical protein
MNFKDINANPVNPRRIEKDRLKKLGELYTEFGDLAGITLNLDGTTISGHQRLKTLKGKKPKVVALEKLDTPEIDGTVERGVIETADGQRHAYRVVDWPKEKADRATIIANGELGGEWDAATLRDHWFFSRDELQDMGVPDFVFEGWEDEPPEDGLTRDAREKPVTLTIRFPTAEDLQQCEGDIQKLLTKICPAASYSVSAGEA